MFKRCNSENNYRILFNFINNDRAHRDILFYDFSNLRLIFVFAEFSILRQFFYGHLEKGHCEPSIHVPNRFPVTIYFEIWEPPLVWIPWVPRATLWVYSSIFYPTHSRGYSIVGYVESVLLAIDLFVILRRIWRFFFSKIRS